MMENNGMKCNENRNRDKNPDIAQFDLQINL